ncbi:hypothetical protein MN608_02981 [Microdochium nivale]|nr:hypothetical protein MN608_02981 [Microdochium nivale]
MEQHNSRANTTQREADLSDREAKLIAREAKVADRESRAEFIDRCIKLAYSNIDRERDGFTEENILIQRMADKAARQQESADHDKVMAARMLDEANMLQSEAYRRINAANESQAELTELRAQFVQTERLLLREARAKRQELMKPLCEAVNSCGAPSEDEDEADYDFIMDNWKPFRDEVERLVPNYNRASVSFAPALLQNQNDTIKDEATVWSPFRPVTPYPYGWAATGTIPRAREVTITNVEDKDW